ncbi:hypothetical protein [Botryobacter ruber]|uniref:hypothetical protein n=1 Tax=Botryobacter ruber TaxID=2171629 RepID=UPI000F6551E7|nr:hypothetical protein [Botryobacter ruber]
MLQVKKRRNIVEQRRESVVRVRLALGYFVLVAVLGLLLRWLLVAPVSWLNYKNILHAHSHVALLGWLYCAFFATLLYAYKPQSEQARKSFRLQFWLTQVAVQGMLLSFPVQGYALFSITFSTLQILLTYWFAWRFWRHVKDDQLLWHRHYISLRFVLLSLVFLVLSSFGPWALGPVMATGGAGGELYYSAIYFYLHFQYNGWFTFAALGLLFWFLENRNITYNKSYASRVFWLLTLACVPAFALSVLWTKPAAAIYWTGGVAAVLQIVALGYLLRLLWAVRLKLARQLQPWVKFLSLLALVSLVVKLAMQLVSAFPYFADLAYRLRYFVIGYLHLSLIGFVSLFVLGFFLQQRLLRLSAMGRAGMVLLLVCFFLTEALLFGQGTLLWQGLPAVPAFNLVMFIASIGMPVGVLLLFLDQPGLYLYKRPIAAAEADKACA